MDLRSMTGISILKYCGVQSLAFSPTIDQFVCKSRMTSPVMIFGKK